MKFVKVKCEYCKNEFERYLGEINRSKRRGLKIYCSLKCSGADKRGEKPKTNNCSCAWCGKEFYRATSKIKLSKSGLLFCSRKCKDLAQGINGLKELHLPHYGTANGAHSYRKIAFENHPHHCNRCGYRKFIEVLQVHHKDRNRQNNEPDNLEILCPTCHFEDHFLAKDGLFK